jgi:4-amino-4-deoxy-L-arabinose transferase-like glycosyltransferase
LFQLFKSKQFPFWALALTLMIALILPVSLQDGMFMDGVLYACVSNNLSQGIGSPWFLKFSELGFADLTTFHEHPPLIFWIQSLFYKVFGNSFYVERLYSFATALGAAWLIHKNWKLVNYKNPNLANNAWLAVIFWMIIPIVFWSFQNNMQENTMSLFSLTAVYFALKALLLKQKIFLNLFLTGLMIFAASFAKGVPGFFPLVIVFAVWLFFRTISFKQMILYSLFVLLSTALCYGLILFSAEARESLSIYVFERLLGRIEAQPTQDSHFYILIRLFMEILPLIVFVFLFHLVYRIKKIPHQLDKDKLRIVGFFFFMGICGSIPIMLTLVQKTFYIGASMPFFGIALAMLAAPGFSKGLSNMDTAKKSFKFFKGSMVLGIVVALVVSFTQIGKVSRNNEVLNDVYEIAEIVPDHSLMSVDPLLFDHWDLHVYLMRYFNISMDNRKEVHQDYLLIDKSIPFEVDSAYQIVELNTLKYDLYELKSD